MIIFYLQHITGALFISVNDLATEEVVNNNTDNVNEQSTWNASLIFFFISKFRSSSPILV